MWRRRSQRSEVPRAHRAALDIERAAIRGGSAGGFTVLASLAFHNVFKAGRQLLRRQRLGAASAGYAQVRKPLPGSPRCAPSARASALRRTRAHSATSNSFEAPLITFQGAEDKVVPPESVAGHRDCASEERVCRWRTLSSKASSTDFAKPRVSCGRSKRSSFYRRSVRLQTGRPAAPVEWVGAKTEALNMVEPVTAFTLIENA